MAFLDVENISPLLGTSFCARIPSYRIVEEGKYAVFVVQIVVSSHSWTVERRYRDFLAYDEARFPDRRLSFLPPKRLIGSLEEAFLEERRMELEKYVRAVLELEVWQSKRRLSLSLPLLTARFFDFHQYEIHSICDDLSVRLAKVGEEWLSVAEQRPRFFEFSPIELHSISRRLALEGAARNNGPVDIGDTAAFLHSVGHIRVHAHATRQHVGTSTIATSALPFSLSLCKSLRALWLTDCRGIRVSGLASVRRTLRRLIAHYTLSELADLLGDLDDEKEPRDVEGDEDKERVLMWSQLAHVDFSFNGLKELDSSVKCLGSVGTLVLAHNALSDVGPHMQHLHALTSLDLSHNEITSCLDWYRKLGNLKKLNLNSNQLVSLQGLGKLYSLEELSVCENRLADVDAVAPIGALPCLVRLRLKGNPVRRTVDYRVRVLHLFGGRFHEVELDGRRASSAEADALSVRLALSRARAEKADRERQRATVIERHENLLDGGQSSTASSTTQQQE